MNSEDALRDLEKSTDDPAFLLDHAAKIVYLGYDHNLGEFVRDKSLSNTSDAHEFRLHWVLKWLLKKLQDQGFSKSSTNQKPHRFLDGGQLLLNEKAWALLVILMHSISTAALSSILIERNLTHLLILAGTSLQTAQELCAPPASSTKTRDDQSSAENHVRKKRRLSPSDTNVKPLVGNAHPVHDKRRLLVAFIKVLKRYAQVVQVSSSSLAGSSDQFRRSIPAAWALTLDNASRLMSCVLQAVIGIHNEANELANVNLANEAAIKWLRLWHEYAVSSGLDPKVVNRSFCGTSLNSCLELLVLSQSLSVRDSESALRQALERQIAYHVVLPLRSDFNQRFSTKWKNVRDFTSWNIVQPFYDEVVLHLGTALHYTKVMGVEYISFFYDHYASNLLDIAARLLPRNDVRRRQWENPWLNAFFTVLIHLAFPQHLFRLQANKEGLLEPENADLPFDTALADHEPSHFLAILQTGGIRLASSTALYVFSSILRWRNSPLPIAVLLQLAEVDTSVFIPQTTNPNPGTCLDLLLDQVREQHIQSAKDFLSLVNGVILPVMRAFARSRDIGGIVKLWIPRLQDAFLARLDDQRDTLDPAFLYDDELLFSGFEDLIRSEAPQGYGKEIAQSVGENLLDITSRIGPTSDIFAHLAIFCCILRARAKNPMSPRLEMDVSAMATNVIHALQQKSDYQGQRWRLWACLKLLLVDDPEIVQLENLQELVMSHISHLATLHEEKTLRPTSSWLMESLQVSSIVITHSLHFAAQCEILAKYLQHVLSDLIHQINDGKESGISWLGNAWDGRFSTMQSTDQLVCGLLGCLLSQRSETLKDFKLMLLADVQRIAFEASKASTDESRSAASLGALVQNLLACFSEVDKSSLFGYYGDVLLLDQCAVIPSTMHGLPLDGLEKKRAKVYADHLVENLIGSPDPDNSVSAFDLTSNLALLSKIVTEFPVSIGVFKRFSTLLEVARATDSIWYATAQGPAEDIELLSAILIRCFRCIIEVAWARLQQLEEKERKLEVTKVLHWCTTTTERLTTTTANPSDIILLDAVLALIGEDAGRIPQNPSISEYEDRYIDILVVQSDEPQRRQLVKHLAQSDGTLSRSLRGSRGSKEWSRVLDQLRSVPLGQNVSVSELRVPDEKVAEESSVGTGYASVGKLRSLIQQISIETRIRAPGRQSDTLRNLSQSRHTGLEITNTIKIADVLLASDRNEIENHPELAATIATLACPNLGVSAKSAENLIFELDICQIVLMHYQTVIGQATIDKLLQSLALTCSSSWRPQVSLATEANLTKHSNGVAIYDRLTNIAGILLSRYRRRLNGRSHLVSALLQNLLRCLFYQNDRKYLYQNPATIKQKQAFRSSLPDWLSQGNQEALPPKCAESFARLLSSICNPTTASARSAQKGKLNSTNLSFDLNDETKKAKKIASQYMQYILAEYARSVLDGVITPDARDKLMPGLFSILDAMDRNMMNVVNTAMDASSRAIFKELYDDWTRFGKWDQR